MCACPRRHSDFVQGTCGCQPQATLARNFRRRTIYTISAPTIRNPRTDYVDTTPVRQLAQRFKSAPPRCTGQMIVPEHQRTPARQSADRARQCGVIARIS